MRRVKEITKKNTTNDRVKNPQVTEDDTTKGRVGKVQRSD
jgi:hypothetical protein